MRRKVYFFLNVFKGYVGGIMGEIKMSRGFVQRGVRVWGFFCLEVYALKRIFLISLYDQFNSYLRGDS